MAVRNGIMAREGGGGLQSQSVAAIMFHMGLGIKPAPATVPIVGHGERGLFFDS